MRLYFLTLANILKPYIVLLVALKPASISKMDRSFVIRAQPKKISSMTERPCGHRSRMMPLFMTREARRDCK